MMGKARGEEEEDKSGPHHQTTADQVDNQLTENGDPLN